MLVTVAGGTEIPLELTRQLEGCGLCRGTSYPPLSSILGLCFPGKATVVQSDYIVWILPAGTLKRDFASTRYRFLLTTVTAS